MAGTPVIAWLTAFLDLPAASHEAGTAFWEVVTASTRSPARGARSEFATLDPADGDAYLRVQRIDDGGAHLHLDVHAVDVDAAADAAVRAGASVVARRGYVVIASPGGFVCCIVGHHGEQVRPSPTIVDGVGPALVDQLALDIPAALYEREAAFWSTFTAWPRRTLARPEFELLVAPSSMPLRLLLHRLGPDDVGTRVRAHLDIACGTAAAALAARHERLGAHPVRDGPTWKTMRDPAGVLYCLTARSPTTGSIER